MHGFEKFPLINQTYHPNYREMVRDIFLMSIFLNNFFKCLNFTDSIKFPMYRKNWPCSSGSR